MKLFICYIIVFFQLNAVFCQKNRQINLVFNPVFGNQTIAFNDSVYLLKNGNNIKFFNTTPVGAAAGASVPLIKTLKLTGITSSFMGNFATVAHGLNSTKILGVQVLVFDGTNSFAPEYTAGIPFTPGNTFSIYPQQSLG